MIKVFRFDRTLVFLPFLDEVIGSLRMCIVVNSSYIVDRGECGVDKLALED